MYVTWPIYLLCNFLPPPPLGLLNNKHFKFFSIPSPLLPHNKIKSSQTFHLNIRFDFLAASAVQVAVIWDVRRSVVQESDLHFARMLNSEMQFLISEITEKCDETRLWVCSRVICQPSSLGTGKTPFEITTPRQDTMTEIFGVTRMAVSCQSQSGRWLNWNINFQNTDRSQNCGRVESVWRQINKLFSEGVGDLHNRNNEFVTYSNFQILRVLYTCTEVGHRNNQKALRKLFLMKIRWRRLTDSAFCGSKMLIIKMITKAKSLLFCVFIQRKLCKGMLWFALSMFCHFLFATHSEKISFRLSTFNRYVFFRVKDVT